MEGPVSKASDVYSWAMVVIEVGTRDLILIECAAHRHKVFTGNFPFHNRTPTAVGVDVLSGNRPERPTDPKLTDDLWDLTEQCWDQDPQERPEITEVVLRLRTCVEMDGTTLGSFRLEGTSSSEFPFTPSGKGQYLVST